MEKYKFCTKGSNEAISVSLQSCKAEAIEFFAGTKHLDIATFLHLYDVKEHDERVITAPSKDK